MDKIELSFEFVEKYVRFANPQYILSLIHI